MKKSDYILIIALATVSILAYSLMRIFLNSTNAEDGTAIVYYRDSAILEIYLLDGTYEILNQNYDISYAEGENDNYYYTVPGSDDNVVVIEYKNHQVRVTEEVSPKHICRIQGWSSSPLSPITCLPNYLVIVIEADKGDDEPDDITG